MPVSRTPANADFLVTPKDSAAIDGFARLRVSNPTTIFDSKQIFDDQALFWDETTGLADFSTAHSADTASTVITYNGGATGGTFQRRTIMKFNYQPGKSQLILMTGILDRTGGGTGINRRIGYFDDDNGLFFEDDEGTVKVTRRTNVTGTSVDNQVTQASWNIDPMDGTGPSGVTIDWEKTQIFAIDFEWLGVGRVRMGLVIDGVPFYVHQFLNANALDKVYMSTPNLPLTYELEAAGGSTTSTMEHICTSIVSEGGAQDNGILRYNSTEDTNINANSVGTIYAIYAIRLKSGRSGATIKIESVTALNTTGDDFEWMLLLNPTVANAITFTGEANSSVETGPGNSGNPSNSTLTSGTLLAGGFVKASGSSGDIIVPVSNALLLGCDLAGNLDEIYLGVRPLTSNADIHGGITWRELA